MPVAARLDGNESLFREVNERIRLREEDVRVPSTYVGFVCECLKAGCTTRVNATLDEYRSLRRRPAQFLTAAGHVDPGERVVLATDRFVIVERA
jgi:hypothetical protein